jgi:photosystem II stability/assembly factor-like uncharacterized protein
MVILMHTNSIGQWEILNAGGVYHSIDFVNDKVGWMVGDGTLLKTEDGGDTWESLTIDPKWVLFFVDFVNENVGWCSGQYWDREEGVSHGIISKSVDGGQSWTMQCDYWGGIIHALDDSVVYVDFLKTTDGGRNWIEVGPDEEDLELYSIWFFNPDSGIAAGSGIIYKTSNGGNSWKIITDPNVTKFDNLQFMNDSTGYFLAFDENGKGTLCFTTDACDSWTITTESHLSMECFSFFDHNKVCALMSDSLGNWSMMISNNGGSTWEQKVILPSRGEYWRGRGEDYEMYFYNPHLRFILSVIWGGRAGIFGSMVLNSKDDGNTWIIQQISYPFQDVYFTDKNVGFVSGGASEWHGDGWGDLFKTYDGGRTWCSSFQSCYEVRSVLLLDPYIGYILSTQTSAGTLTNIYKTTDGGNTWHEVYADVPDSTDFYFAGKEMYFLNENIGWIAGAGFHNDTSGAAFLYTMDCGESWDVTWISLDSDDYNYALNSIYFVDSTLGWTVGEGGLIVKYTERDQWQTQSQVTDLPLKDVFFSDKDNGWIAGGYLNEQDFQSILLKTIDGGITWKEIRDSNYLINDVFFKDSLNGIAVGNDTNRVYWNWQIFGSCRGVILKTTDGGENWFIEVGDLPASLTAIHSKDGYCWAVGENGLILRYNDLTWIEDKLIPNKVPHRYELSQNHPNPFNPSTVISWQLAVGSNVELNIYNILGQKIETLLNKPMPAGYHEVEFNGQNLPSGVYLYRIDAGAWQDVRKMVLLK